MSLKFLQHVFVYSEITKWAIQNAIGVILPMLFVVVKPISFTGACGAVLFYCVSCQAFSIDRTIGGRLYGGLVWIAVILTGGLLGFTVSNLAWLARGSDVPYQGLNAIQPGENPSLSSWFWILLMVLHVVFDVVLMYTRVYTSGPFALYTNICQLLMSVLTIFGMALMPTLGPEKFWTDAYSPLIKAHLILLLGMIMGSTLVYVKSSHDSLREQIGDMCIEIGKIFSLHASRLNAVLCSSEKASVESKHAALVDWSKNVQMVKSADMVLRMSLGAQKECYLCSFEPAWWNFCSQPGANAKRYGHAITKFQVLLQTINSLDTITSPRIQAVMEKGAEPLSAEWKILETSYISLALLSGVIQEMISPLKHMPYGAVCSGDGLAWRPHSLEFWNSAMKRVSDTIKGCIDPLKRSILSGLEKTLEEEHSEASDIRGFGIALLTLIEHLMDECIGIEIAVGKALDISSCDLYSLDPHVEDSLQVPTTPPDHRYGARAISKAAHSTVDGLLSKPYTSSLMNNLLIGTGLRLWQAQWNSIMLIAQMLRAWICGILKGQETGDVPQVGGNKDPILALNRTRNRNLYMKLFVGYNLSIVSVILIGWYCYAGSDDYADNAESIANWFSNWQPYYFVLAFSVCAQDTVDSSTIKAILRVSLIGLGGSLGYATMLNGSLAQNPYYMFFMAILFNLFFGLFSYISFDFRYSLFLALYTWAGVATCQYTGICCAAGSVTIFLGKFVSTALGAIYAFVISNVVFPVFSSQVVSELEGSLLSTYMSAVQDSYEMGAILLQTPETDRNLELLNPKYPCIGFKTVANHHGRMVHYITKAVGKRLSIISRIYTEVDTKALDKHFMFFIRLTLIPLPISVKLILQRLTKIGSYVNTSVKTLKCSFLRTPGGTCSESFLGAMLEKSDSCLVAAHSVEQKTINILIRKRVHPQDVEALREALDSLVLARAELRIQYLKILPELNKMDGWNYGDLRCLTWFTMLIRAIKELEGLAQAMTDESSPYLTKGGTWIFPLVHLNAADF
jgi:hypothetical protein